MRHTTQAIVDIGQKLVEVKEGLGHGCFGIWLQTEFEWMQKTAKRFINVVASRWSQAGSHRRDAGPHLRNHHNCSQDCRQDRRESDPVS